MIDGSDYFRVLREAITRAQRTVFIVGWDIDHRMKFTPEGSDDGCADALDDFLHDVAASRKRLRIYILVWDFAVRYAFEREWLPVYKMGWRTHRRVAFQMDGTQPMAGSHHQKRGVIDDKLAFVGGLDLTRSRWDTPEHAAANSRRRERLHELLTQADVHDGYRLMSPSVPKLATGCVNVHNNRC